MDMRAIYVVKGEDRISDSVYLSNLKSLGAAHWVAQCCRWKTEHPLALIHLAERRVFLHSSTQSSLGPLYDSSSCWAVTRSTHS